MAKYMNVTTATAVIRGKVREYMIAKKGGLFYIFDSEGGMNTEQCFSSVERALAYVPTMDHMVAFSACVRR